MMRFLVFSLLLVGCATPRPDVDLCIVNAPALHRKCYNMERDYQSDGSLKTGAAAVYRRNETVKDLNKFFVVDHKDGPTVGLANLKAYIKTLREEAENSCGGKKAE